MIYNTLKKLQREAFDDHSKRLKILLRKIFLLIYYPVLIVRSLVCQEGDTEDSDEKNL